MSQFAREGYPIKHIGLQHRTNFDTGPFNILPLFTTTFQKAKRLNFRAPVKVVPYASGIHKRTNKRINVRFKITIDSATHSHYSQLTLVVIVKSLSEFFPIGFDQGHDSFRKLSYRSKSFSLSHTKNT